MLRVEGVSVRVDGRDILKRVYLQMGPGEIHALLGLNGSGKSSLAYTLMGCSGYQPYEGRIWFAGQDITRASITERGRLGLTLAWQEPARFEGLLVSRYLAAGARQAGAEVLAQALSAVGLSPQAYLHRRVDTGLSGGERKRIEMAAVVAMRPKLAILDEPDSGVDAFGLADLTALLRRMARDGSGVLLITHRDELAAVADRVWLMCLGSIVRAGPAVDVIAYYRQRCTLHGELTLERAGAAADAGQAGAPCPPGAGTEVP